MPSQHALLSPSSAHRWLNCPPSAKLCAAQEETTSVYAQQGTDAHELCQHKLEKALGLDTKNPTENLTYYDAEMEDCACDYTSFVMETLAHIKETCPDPVVLIEQRLDFSHFVPQGFGRGDCVIIADGTMHVIDFKYGLGVLVSAKDNPQMLCYALGALELLDSLYEFDQISMTIFQPPRDNISTSTISKGELLAWAENTLAPTAKLAYEGKGEFKAGDHCQFCKIKATCRKRAEYNLDRAAIEAAYHDGEGKLRGTGKSVPALSALKTPLRDGDAERPDDPAYAGAYFMNANSTTAPGIVDADCQRILDRSEVYSGVYTGTLVLSRYPIMDTFTP